jgi:hypothetical protein
MPVVYYTFKRKSPLPYFRHFELNSSSTGRNSRSLKERGRPRPPAKEHPWPVKDSARLPLPFNVSAFKFAVGHASLRLRRLSQIRYRSSRFQLFLSLPSAHARQNASQPPQTRTFPLNTNALRKKFPTPPHLLLPKSAESARFRPFAKKSAALISPHPPPAKSTGRTASLQTRPTVRRESTAPQAPSLSPPIGSCCLLFPEVPQTMPGQQLPRVPLSVCVSIYTGRGLDMPKNPQMSVIWDWFHCAAVRSRRNGTSPRTVTSVLKWTGYRAGFAHGETLEIRVCGRGLSCDGPQ